jgi:hypothetical protein
VRDVHHLPKAIIVLEVCHKLFASVNPPGDSHPPLARNFPEAFLDATKLDCICGHGR